MIITLDMIFEIIGMLFLDLSLIMLIMVASGLAVKWIYKYDDEVYKRATLVAVLIFLIGACSIVIGRLL